MIILVTGTSRGIGRATAEYYLSKGFIVIGCSRSFDNIIEDKNYRHYICDVTNEDNIKTMIRSIKKEYSYLDVLINNAGMASMNHFLLTPKSTYDKLFSVNTLGTFLMCRECSKIMRKSQNPSIVNFTTVAVPLNLEGEALYVASKSAVESLTRVISKELSSMKIRVNAIGPTPVDTSLIAGVPEEKIELLLKSQTIKRKGKFDDVLNVLDFFVSERSTFINGQILYLGGVN
ncbi:enoyl-(Acyl carrier protein) reductase domain protein [Bacteriovorax sp. BAL6_X]|uniref:SDR family oxidoreductase n=1 Tax=Bacteriovorax sp. BAL6_X TaxID=1201290 RepID=UPI000386AA56|nr:SDR family oxidoreductase [Bacteriovorax sp. BAL6_X]EPZ50366.1 enoyl-(Acyl carrier protein) reductase domain protein [Bacteriovorax sp. BAL6_X]